MATIKIPPVLRASVGGEKEVSASGENVGDVLRDLAANHPATQSQLFSAEGELNRYVNVYLNDEDVRVLDGLDTRRWATATPWSSCRRWPAAAHRASASVRRARRFSAAPPLRSASKISLQSSIVAGCRTMAARA